MRRQDRELFLALEAAIESTFIQADWTRIGYETGTNEWINGHPRLLRSLSWGDDDYPARVFEALEYLRDQDQDNLDKLLEMPKIEQWIKENRPEVFARYYGDNLLEETVSTAEKAGRGFDIHDHIQRIRAAQETDPALALGSTKEMLESVFKEILGIYGSKSTGEDFPDLWKRVQDVLGLSPGTVSAGEEGADARRRLLQGLRQIAISVNELRNLYGTGHGKAQATPFDEDSVYVAVNSGITLATYLMNRYERLKAAKRAK